MKTQEDHPYWTARAYSLYNEPYLLLIEKLYDQLADFLGERPSYKFITDYLNVIQNINPFNPVRNLFEAVKNTYGLNKALHFIDKNREMNKTVRALQAMIYTVHFMVASERVFEDLMKTPIYCN